MDGSRWIPLPYLFCVGVMALLGASVTAAVAAPSAWNDFAVLNLAGMLRDLSGAFLFGLVALACTLAALVESSLRDRSV